MFLAPHPYEIASDFVGIVAGPSLLAHVLPSFMRVSVALALSGGIGVPAGYLAARSNRLGTTVSAVVSGVRYLPPTAFIGLLIIGLGVGSPAAIGLMVIGVAPYVAIMSADVVRAMPVRYEEVARTFGATKTELFSQVVIPYALPRIVDVLKVNVGAAWTFLVAAEIIAGNSGVGYLIARAQRYIEVQQLYALLLVCALCGVAMDFLLGAMSRHLGRWSPHAEA